MLTHLWEKNSALSFISRAGDLYIASSTSSRARRGNCGSERFEIMKREKTMGKPEVCIAESIQAAKQEASQRRIAGPGFDSGHTTVLNEWHSHIRLARSIK